MMKNMSALLCFVLAIFNQLLFVQQVTISD